MEGLTDIDATFRAVPASWMAAAGFLLGAIVGSFLATILVRWPEGRRVAAGRSCCDGCGVELGPRELVPVLSYLLSSGRCRRCGGAIDPRHLGIEIASGFVGAVALVAHPSLLGIATALFGWWLLLLAALDLEEQWLPDRLTLPLIPLGFAAALLSLGPPLADRLIGAAAGFASLVLIAAAYRKARGREGLGGGDPKMLAGLGAWLGWQQLPLVLVGAGLLGLCALLLNRLRGERVDAADRLPLGTLIALAAWPLWLMVATPA